MGGSKVIIDLENGSSSFHALMLEHWSRQVKCLIFEFSFISFEHIYREYSVEVNFLSKLLIGEMDGGFFYEEFRDGVL